MSIPRLLPVTIGAMTLVLALKLAGIARQASAGAFGAGVVFTAASAATEPAPAARAAVADAAPAPASAPEPAAASDPVGDAERKVLLELRQRRQSIDTHEQAVAQREAMLGAAEQRLARRVDELQALQGRLEALEAARRERDAANWQGLVATYEKMKPRDAAPIFNDMDWPVLLPILDRMKESRAAALLAAMNPDRARLATQKLAEARLAANTPATTRPAP